MRRPWLALLVLPVALVGGCALLLRFGWLPERYAVNVPLRQAVFGRGVEAPPPEAFGARIRVPEGFRIALYADGIPNARLLRFSEAGDLLVSQPRSGKVLLLERDADGDGRADATHTLLEGLARPHGLDLHEGWLYVGETDAVGRVRFDTSARRTLGNYQRVVTGLPEGGNHWTRTIRFGPDGWLYVSVGSSCNACLEVDPRRAALLRYRPDGSGEQLFATGLRNAVGFDWQPGSGELYATDNGRDLLGDDAPPCELNRVVDGGFYGWPFAYGARVRDPELGPGREREIAASIPPVHDFRAHNAPLGILFVRGTSLPPAYRGAALVALHGSWNRTRKDGYKVVSLHPRPGGGFEERDFAWGFLEDDDVIGRPVDVAEGPDGAFYISDDYAGAVYRVAFGAGPPATAAAALERGPTPAGALAALAPDEREAAAARGAALFEAHGCAGCHDAARAEAGVVPRELEGVGARYDLEALAAFLAAPTPPMPVAPLDPGERRDLAVHLLSLFP